MNNLYVRLAKNNLKNNKSLYVPYMVAGMITVLMFYIMMFINNSAGLEKMRGAFAAEEGNPQNELTSGAKNGMIQRDKCEEEEQYPHLKAKREGGRCKPLCRMWGSRLGAAALKRE